MSVYIHLFHGRSDPDKSMDDWGDDGPVLGPFEYVQITYLQTLRLGLPDGGDGWIRKVDDMLYYDGVYYGDLDIVSSKNDRGINPRKAKEFSPGLALRPGDPPIAEDEDGEEKSSTVFTCRECKDEYDEEDRSESDSSVCVNCEGDPE